MCSAATLQAPPGYHGRYLRVDVTTGQAEPVAIPSRVLRQYLGGVGLGTWILLREGAAEIDPLSPAAPLAFVFSPLVGSPLTTSAKFAVVSRSPLTGRINDSLASSQFALAGKRTGHDALVLKGRANRPTVVQIDDGRVTLEPAEGLWGLDCPTAEAALRNKLGSDWSAAVIGPAGERLVRYATLSHDGRHAGRGGTGAVLGAKQVKAVAVRGQRRTAWARPEELVAAARELSELSFGPATAKYRELGTATNLLAFNRLHALPTRNFQQGSFAGVADLAPEQLTSARSKARQSCAACTIGCEHLYELTPGTGDTGGQGKVRVEYENLFALGPLCGVSDPQTVLSASHRCDALGLDTISAGGTIAFAMEAAERGWLDAPWLRFGDGGALLRALELIGHREGLGDLLAEGSRRVAERWGPEALAIAPQVKGLELPGYEPRALQSMALGFAVGTRGADHNRSGAYELDFSERVDRRAPGIEAASWAVETEDRAALMDSLVLCKFLRGVFQDYYADLARLLNLVTGWDTTAAELRETAGRIVAAKKWFNQRAGWTPAEDTLPDRFFREPLPDDAAAVLTRDRLDALRRAYHAARRWDAEGWLPAATVEALRSDLVAERTGRAAAAPPPPA